MGKPEDRHIVGNAVFDRTNFYYHHVGSVYGALGLIEGTAESTSSILKIFSV
jgi:hypothetical protein